jgi:hypothetical protein
MDARDLTPAETIPASRKLGRDDAAKLLKGKKRLLVAKGKKTAEFSIGTKPSAEAIDAMLGPTGNLRAPTVVVGTLVVVGFSEDTYASAL